MNWTVIKKNGAATISENQFLIRYSVTLIIFFPGSNACDNSSAIIKKDVDVVSDFINENNCESDKDDSVFINNCDYVFRELNLSLCSDVDTAKANFLYLLEVAV